MKRLALTAVCLLTAGCSVVSAMSVDSPEAQPAATVVITTPPPTKPPVKITDDDRLAMEALAPYLLAYQREQYGHCGEFYDDAMSVGWQPEEWKKLRHIIARETGNTCDPTVLNDNPNTGDLSYGLTQINMRNRLGPDRVARCGLSSYEDLWIPAVNLACARVLYLMSGWEPWAYTPK